jgi:predicted protein tyrosine phosphatase
MRFLVYSRLQAERLDLREPHAVISIREPGSRMPVIPENEFCRGVLRLSFHDLLRVVDSTDEPFTAEHAEQILEFVDRVAGDGVTLVVHCEAGISRSAGVAAALSRSFLGADASFFENYIPNSLIYGMLLEAWRSRAARR